MRHFFSEFALKKWPFDVYTVKITDVIHQKHSKHLPYPPSNSSIHRGGSPVRWAVLVPNSHQTSLASTLIVISYICSRFTGYATVLIYDESIELWCSDLTTLGSSTELTISIENVANHCSLIPGNVTSSGLFTCICRSHWYLVLFIIKIIIKEVSKEWEWVPSGWGEMIYL